jgi:hypothetical protein
MTGVLLFLQSLIKMQRSQETINNSYFTNTRSLPESKTEDYVSRRGNQWKTTIGKGTEIIFRELPSSGQSVGLALWLFQG